MIYRNTTAIWLLGLALVLALVGAVRAKIPPPLPYDYEGTYWVDRWGQHHFGGHFVAPKLFPRLKSITGLPVKLKVTEMNQSDRGPGVIYDFAGFKELPRPFEVILSYLEPAEPIDETEKKQLEKWTGDLDSPKYGIRQKAEQNLIKAGIPALPFLRQVQGKGTLEAVLRAKRCIDAIASRPEKKLPLLKPLRKKTGDTVYLKVTVINKSGHDQPALPAKFVLTHTTHYPFRPDGSQADLWTGKFQTPKSRRNAEDELFSLMKKLEKEQDKAQKERWNKKVAELYQELTKREFLFWYSQNLSLLPQNQTATWTGKENNAFEWSYKGTLPPLKHAESRTWTIAVTKDWDAEAELGGTLMFIQDKEHRQMKSNTLRLDLVGDKRAFSQPLKIEIKSLAKGKAQAGQSIPVEISFTNISNKPLVFDLPFRDVEKKEVFLSDQFLFAYDQDGTLLPKKNLEKPHYHFGIRLKPGQIKTLSTQLPPGPTCARFATPVLSSGWVREDNNGGPQITLNYPHGCLSPLLFP